MAPCLTNLVRQFMAEDSHAGGDSTPGARGEGDTNGHPVSQIVYPVPQDHHPGHARQVAGGGVKVGVSMRVSVVNNLAGHLSGETLLSLLPRVGRRSPSLRCPSADIPRPPPSCCSWGRRQGRAGGPPRSNCCTSADTWPPRAPGH